ncbi:hypothetical protein NDU88_004376 [Pleurodeles waltl]|uniref:Uncharacterized protein n=1 Tax=Pleurodeles waltl TaxID=8319 RepID=A0AAV7W8T4_PLEWA|nr:hypothetical protein NDU88_004376 [Pleurodeles waltl]
MAATSECSEEDLEPTALLHFCVPPGTTHSTIEHGLTRENSRSWITAACEEYTTLILGSTEQSQGPAAVT